MKTFRVVGPGCNSCRTTAALIAGVANARGVAIELEEINDPAQFAALGVTRTPAIMLDGEIVFSGGAPDWGQVENWLTQTTNVKDLT